MQQSRGTFGHSKHRKACVHNGGGTESSKGHRGAMSEHQKFLLMKERERLQAGIQRPRPEMVDDIRKLWRKKRGA